MGDRLLSWFDVAGNEWPLNGETFYRAIVGPTGLYGVPVSIITQDVPMQPGTAEKYVQRLARQPAIPLFMQADSEETLDSARRALRWAMAPSRGVGVLRHTSNDGMIRDLNCRLAKGFEGDENPNVRFPGAMTLPLEFFAADPFWYDTDYQQQIFGTSGGTPLLGTGVAFLPIHLAPTGVVGGASVANNGDDVAWPLWTLTGPMTAATFTNNTTGDVLTITATLADATKTITIDTSPGQKTVIREDASKHFEYVSATSTLWGLAVGTNSITISITGSGAGTQLTLQYKQRYEGV
jgi:hypothetical protein